LGGSKPLSTANTVLLKRRDCHHVDLPRCLGRIKSILPAFFDGIDLDQRRTCLKGVGNVRYGSWSSWAQACGREVEHESPRASLCRPYRIRPRTGRNRTASESCGQRRSEIRAYPAILDLSRRNLPDERGRQLRRGLLRDGASAWRQRLVCHRVLRCRILNDPCWRGRNSLIPFGGTRATVVGGLAWQNQSDTR
jgi:hypothetical protein